MENCPSKFTGIAQIFTSLHVLEFGKTHALLESWCMVIIVLVKPLRFHRKLFNRCLLVLHNQTIPKLLSPNLPTKFNSPFQGLVSLKIEKKIEYPCLQYVFCCMTKITENYFPNVSVQLWRCDIWSFAATAPNYI